MKKTIEEIEVTPTEDLMREHGILNRILLIYEEVLIRIQNGSEFRLALINDAATIIKDFIEDYHEKLEEQYIFPLFNSDPVRAALVVTLIEQHQAGRKLTNSIRTTVSAASNVDSVKNKKELARWIAQFICMYRAHESREDTNLFPQVKKLVSEKAFADIAELFEKTEHDLFGPDGYNAILKKVEKLEKELNINDLSRYTPGENQRCFTQDCLFCKKQVS